MILSKWRIMWLMVLFDLPVKTELDKKRYREFREYLLEDGFLMTQFSCYTRHNISEEMATVHEMRVAAVVPPRGEVRILRFTDAQFARMKIFVGIERKRPEKGLSQLELF